MQRTRLRRGRAVGLVGQKPLARRGHGRHRRAADAIVGQGAEEEARRRRKEKAKAARTHDFEAAEAAG